MPYQEDSSPGLSFSSTDLTVLRPCSRKPGPSTTGINNLINNRPGRPETQDNTPVKSSSSLHGASSLARTGVSPTAAARLGRGNGMHQLAQVSQDELQDDAEAESLVERESIEENLGRGGQWEVEKVEELLDLVTSDITRSPKGPIALSNQAVPPSVSPATPLSENSQITPGMSQKRKGRPKGWRPGMGLGYAALRNGGIAPPPSLNKSVGPPKKRGRPARQPSPPPRHIYDALDVRFTPYLCEWERCPAQLQNFETLRRHVAVVHSKSEACKWGECARGDVEVQLPTAMDFERHLEEMHLTPLVWHVGDGPKNGTHVPATRGNGEPLPAYLFDADGVQITPSIRGQRYESAEECAERQRNMRRLQRLQAENAPEEEELTEAEMAQINANQDARQWA